MYSLLHKDTAANEPRKWLYSSWDIFTWFISEAHSSLNSIMLLINIQLSFTRLYIDARKKAA